MLGSVINKSQDREGVRIDAPHGWEIHDVHHQWTKNETFHWETGNVFHMTSGQVYHANLNLAELHTTTNVLTMHFDLTPLNVHLRPAFIGMDVHMELSPLRKHYNYHKGHHHLLVSNFHQESQAVHIKSTTKEQSGWDRRADIGPRTPAGQKGKMTLEADGVMTLSSTSEMKLLSGPENNPKAWLTLNGGDGQAGLTSNKLTTVNSNIRTSISRGLENTIDLTNDSLSLQKGGARVVLRDNDLTTNATTTALNGRVQIGNPAIVNLATQAGLAQVSMAIGVVDTALKLEINSLKAKIAEMGRG